MNSATLILLVFTPLLALSAFLVWYGINKEAERRAQQEEYQRRQADLQRQRQEQLRQQQQAIAERQAQQKRLWQTAAALATQISSMDDWREWSADIHTQPEQLTRIRRALDENIRVMAYDPRYRLAKIRGTSGRNYLAGPRCCNCPDFRERHLPCKHMYKLALFLNGDTSKQLTDTAHAPLYALYIVLAGRFPNSALDIKQCINAGHGVFQTDITTDSGILICGAQPSQNKLLYFKRHNLPILQPADIDKLFQPEQPKVNLVKEGE